MPDDEGKVDGDVEPMLTSSGERGGASCVVDAATTAAEEEASPDPDPIVIDMDGSDGEDEDEAICRPIAVPKAGHELSSIGIREGELGPVPVTFL